MASTKRRSITWRQCITHLLHSAALLLYWHACSTLQQRKTLRAPHFRGSPPTTCLRPSNWDFHVFAQNADIGSGHRKMRGITRRHALTSSSFATNATFSGAATHIIEVRTQPLSLIPSPLGRGRGGGAWRKSRTPWRLRKENQREATPKKAAREAAGTPEQARAEG